VSDRRLRERVIELAGSAALRTSRSRGTDRTGEFGGMSTGKALRSREHRRLCTALAEARAQVGLTQRELAARLRRPHSYVAKIEGGERRIDVIEFIELARALRMDPLKLFALVLSE
jgi:ribosome-binding protein aMBF1 (putative translation factor)